MKIMFFLNIILVATILYPVQPQNNNANEQLERFNRLYLIFRNVADRDFFLNNIIEPVILTNRTLIATIQGPILPSIQWNINDLTEYEIEPLLSGMIEQNEIFANMVADIDYVQVVN